MPDTIHEILAQHVDGADTAVLEYVTEMIHDMAPKSFNEVEELLIPLESYVSDTSQLVNDICQTLNIASDQEDTCSKKFPQAGQSHRSSRATTSSTLSSDDENETSNSNYKHCDTLNSHQSHSVLDKVLSAGQRIDPTTGRTIVNDDTNQATMTKEEWKAKKKRERELKRQSRLAKQQTNGPSVPQTSGLVVAETRSNHHTMSVSAKQMTRAALLGAHAMSSSDGRMGIVEGENGEVTEGVVAGAWRGVVHGAASGDTSEICVHKLTISYGPSELLTQAVLRLHFGKKYGLVGRNGAGKTTLLQRLALHQIPGIPRGLRIMLVQHEAVNLEGTPIDCVLAADQERRALQDEIDKLTEEMASLASEETHGEEENPSQPSKVHQLQNMISPLVNRLSSMREEEECKRCATSILLGLGFTETMVHDRASKLSGGWRMRLALAQALFLEPSLLLLDEPTNHLDLEGVMWLEEYLQTYPGTVVVVSHDRSFMDNIVDEIIHIHQNQLKYYPGNYTAFQTARQERIKKMDRLQTNLDKKKAHIQSSIDKMEKAASIKNKSKAARGGAKLKNLKGDEKLSKQIASRKNKLFHMGIDQTEDGKKFNAQLHSRRLGSAADNAGGWKDGKMSAGIIREQIDSEVRFNFPDAPTSGASTKTGDLTSTNEILLPVVQIREVSFRWNEKTPWLFRNVDLSLTLKSRVGLLGSNGAGKSTLLQLLLGNLTPEKGEVIVPRDVKVGMFAQHHIEALDHTITPIQHIQSLYPSASEQEARAQLSAFGITSALATSLIGTLSGGQKSRVVFASISFEPKHVILLDEPTNYLDMESLNALENALKVYNGALVIVSHDRHLLESVCDEFWLVAGPQFVQQGDADDNIEKSENGFVSLANIKQKSKNKDKKSKSSQGDIVATNTGVQILYGEQGFDQYHDFVRSQKNKR